MRTTVEPLVCGKFECGRLALRHEGHLWVAYWAPEQTTMEGALMLGSIRMSLVTERHGPVFEGFIALMRLAFDAVAEDILGDTPTWDAPKPAPESERGGHA